MSTEYDYPDWPAFLAGGGVSEHMRELQAVFEGKLADLRRVHALETPTDTLQRDAFKGFCSIVGHGTGLWDSDDERDHALERVIMADPVLCKLAEELDNEISFADPENQDCQEASNG